MVHFIRTVHGVISLFFLSCLAYIYYAGITGRPTLWAYVAVIALLLEGLVVFVNHGECPLGTVHEKYGGQKAFFEPFLPCHLAKRAIPFLAAVTAIGTLLLAWREL